MNGYLSGQITVLTFLLGSISIAHKIHILNCWFGLHCKTVKDLKRGLLELNKNFNALKIYTDYF